MAESQALAAADSTIDYILEKGANRLYESYIQPKIMPYSAAQVCAIQETLSCCIRMAKDSELVDQNFNEMWEDEGEPVSVAKRSNYSV